jgi:arsenate reductase
MNPERKTILFLCTGNSCRSQMAEAWTRHLKGDVLVPYSAGIAPGRIDPLAIKVMEEVGVDMTSHLAKHVETFRGKTLDFVVTVCDNANETCPYFPGKTRRLHKGFPDPPALTRGMETERALDVYRRVRDEIREFVEQMPGTLSE